MTSQADAPTPNKARVVDEDAIAPPRPRDNRPVTMMHRVEYALALFLMGFFRLIGVGAASFIAGKFLRALGPRVPSIAKRAHDNIRHVFPDWPDERIKAVTAGVFENLGRTVAEYAHLHAFDVNNPDGRVTLQGKEHLDAIRESGRPVIFVSSHLANWEIMAIVLKQNDVKNIVLYRAANNPLIDGFIIRLRARVMSRWQTAKGPQGALDLLRAIKAGYSPALLMDQKLTDGLVADFLGQPARTAPMAARLAQKFKLPIHPGVIIRRRGAQFDMIIRPPIYDGALEKDVDLQAITQRINDSLGEEIKNHPEQWLWLHRRWGKDIGNKSDAAN